MRARLVADLELDGAVVAIEQLDGRCFVALRDRVYVLDGTGLEPVLEGVEVLQMRDGRVLTPAHIVTLDGARLELPSFDGASASRFAPLPDGAIVAVDRRGRVDAAALFRLDASGHVIWRASAAPPATIAGYVSEARREDNFAIKPARPWKPQQWNIVYGDVHVSGDRVLAVYAEMPRSGIGIGYGIDLATGAVVYRTAPGPHGEIAPAPAAGSFLVGLQGYGAFETRLVDRDGVVRTTWPSHGIALPGHPIRIIELENVLPSKSHMATLLDDGGVRRGAHLTGYYTSPAIVAADGSAVFWRDGALMRATPDGERVERLLPTSVPGDPYARTLAGSVPGRVVLNVAGHHEANGARVFHNRLLVVDVAA